MTYHGRCQCGAVRIVAEGAPLRVGMCHCRDCRRHHGALFYAAAIFDNRMVTVRGETASHAGRHVCARCGASVFAVSGDETEVHLGALEDADALVPAYECWTIRRAPWLAPVPGALQFERDRPPDAESGAVFPRPGGED